MKLFQIMTNRTTENNNNFFKFWRRCFHYGDFIAKIENIIIGDVENFRRILLVDVRISKREA